MARVGRNWRAVGCHWLKFNAVGAAGVAVQAVVLAVLVKILGLNYLLATALAVEAAVLHNFAWHRRWTWSDRPGRRGARLLLRFNLTAGALSIVSNVVFMRLLVGSAGLGLIAANLVTIAVCSVLNFALADRYVFT